MDFNEMPLDDAAKGIMDFKKKACISNTLKILEIHAQLKIILLIPLYKPLQLGQLFLANLVPLELHIV